MNINNEQRKALAGIVESNGNYDKFYENRYSKGEAAIIAKANKFLSDYQRLEEAVDALKEAHKAENNKRERAQEKEVQKLTEKLEAIREQAKKVGACIYGKSYSTPAHIGALDQNSRSAYDMWRKTIIAKIWGAEDLESAKKAVNEFWAG